MLSAMPDLDRRLLAARAYLRAGDSLASRWSLTTDEAAAFQDSAAMTALSAAIDRIRCLFEAANPGHTLFVNPEFRSAEVQLANWNTNASVGEAGARLRAELKAPVERDDFRKWLAASQLLPPPTLAAPGLSPHGRMQAIDFQVESQGAIVAGPDRETIEAAWIAAGWKVRLREAVLAAGAGFRGPLMSPDEPWHYEYAPGADPAALPAIEGCRAPGD